MLLNDIKESFLSYFRKNNHKVFTSSSLVPKNDPTLYFTNSGMVQFKNRFINIKDDGYSRIVTAQKCMRAGGKHNDLENVGYTTRHHTFFEMLGNFSFGDYFKEESIIYAWEYLTKELGINKDRLYITIYHKDNESLKIWKKITGFDDNKIIKINTSDNFWSMSNTGPCGPCSEIFYDHGPSYPGDIPGTGKEEGNRYIEVWNLVFMQYEKLKSGKKVNLLNRSVDTGMGLERMSAVMQGVNSNYDIDIFKNLINSIIEASKNNKEIISNKVIADHIRAVCFLIADGVLPSNEGRGYVLRRIIRRAMRHADKISPNDDILFKVALFFIHSMKKFYPELQKAKTLIISTLNIEKTKFKDTLKIGMKYLKNEIRHLSDGSILDGNKGFKLYDTYGFPVDLTVDILRERNITLDHKSFIIAMEDQKKKSNTFSSRSTYNDKSIILWNDIYKKFGATKFSEKEQINTTVEVRAIILNNKLVDSIIFGDKATIITDFTTFYAESGGQVGDRGKINQSIVYDTKKFIDKIHAHFVIAKENIKVGDTVRLSVDYKLRQKIRANHSAVHLLHYVLKKELGDYVVQKGSFVNEEKLHFDFTYKRSLYNDEVTMIEKKVNDLIMLNTPVYTNSMDIQDAKKSNITMLLDTTYRDQVRVVSTGKSVELCCGTHVNYTGDIAMFAIISEQSISSCVRRIEAFTGIKALQFFRNGLQKNKEVCNLLKCNNDNLISNLNDLLQRTKDIRKIYEINKSNSIIKKLEKIDFRTNKILKLKLEDQNINLRTIYDHLKNKKKCIIILVNLEKSDNKAIILIGISKDIIVNYSAKRIMYNFLKLVHGKGGGSNNVAQASVKTNHFKGDIIDKIVSLL